MHVLIVGGTGMLRVLTENYANSDHTITLMARDRKKLSSYKEKRINTRNPFLIDQDYQQSNMAISKIEEVVKTAGNIDLAVLWIHSTGDDFRLKLRDFLIRKNPQVRIFELKGSASIHNLKDNIKKWEDRPPNIRRVVLGQVKTGSTFRWLTDAEICEGTREAIEKDKQVLIVGALS